MARGFSGWTESDFQFIPGLMAKRRQPETKSASGTHLERLKKKTATELFDACGTLEPGE